MYRKRTISPVCVVLDEVVAPDVLTGWGADEFAVDIMELLPQFADPAVQGERPAQLVSLGWRDRVARLEVREDDLALGHRRTQLNLTTLTRNALRGFHSSAAVRASGAVSLIVRRSSLPAMKAPWQRRGGEAPARDLVIGSQNAISSLQCHF